MALVPDVQYGLSSHGNFDERKSLIFVKLTDSSQRAITEYLKIRNNINEKPNIQFLGNEGHLSIPSVDGVARFTFSMGMESSQGGNFELAQQTDSKSLESLGAIPYRMRIRANDDVYETTRHRMAVAEENNKNKCTRVIKANGPDIGRKVKVKGTGRTIPPSSSYARHRESTTSIPTSGNSQPKASINKPIANSSSNSNSSNHLAAVRNVEKKVADIMRRPLKERLIHVLALRPYKKPELYDRINKEGLRDRERPVMTTILKQVAYMRDNTYHLNRHIWNDVQEDWPFYTEQERTMLRRRKPQNLTPPGSSDGGSSGSGQSPNSIHAGSPPAITAPPPNLANKRPGYFQGSDGLPTKKPRISHYKRPEPISFIPAGERVSSSSSYSNINSVSATVGGDRTVDRSVGVNSGCGSGNSGGGGGSNSNNGGSGFDSWESRQQSQRERSSSSRVDYRTERTANSDVPRGTGNIYNDAAIATVSSSSTRSLCLTPLSPDDSERGNPHNPPNYTDGGAVLASYGPSAGSVFEHTERRDRSDRSDRSRGAREERNRERDSRNRSTTASDAAIYGETSNNASTYVDNATGAAAISSSDEFERLGSTGQYHDNRTEYTPITSLEQKRRYKEEFYRNYPEYCRLHSEVLVTANRFRYLYTLWQEQKTSGNMIESQETQEQIYREYKETKQDRVYRQMKERFDYLHNKLEHIKQLISNYDSQNAAGMMSANTMDNGVVSTTVNNGSNNIGGIDNRHY